MLKYNWWCANLLLTIWWRRSTGRGSPRNACDLLHLRNHPGGSALRITIKVWHEIAAPIFSSQMLYLVIWKWTLQNLKAQMYGIRKYGRKIQNALAGYSHIDNLIRQATNTDTWGRRQNRKNSFYGIYWRTQAVKMNHTTTTLIFQATLIRPRLMKSPSMWWISSWAGLGNTRCINTEVASMRSSRRTLWWRGTSFS